MWKSFWPFIIKIKTSNEFRWKKLWMAERYKKYLLVLFRLLSVTIYKMTFNIFHFLLLTIFHLIQSFLKQSQIFWFSNSVWSLSSWQLIVTFFLNWICQRYFYQCTALQGWSNSSSAFLSLTIIITISTYHSWSYRWEDWWRYLHSTTNATAMKVQTLLRFDLDSCMCSEWCSTHVQGSNRQQT